jgi:hypothetical protein
MRFARELPPDQARALMRPMIDAETIALRIITIGGKRYGDGYQG